MIDYFVIAFFVELGLAGLSFLFIKKTIEKKQEKKWVKCGITTFCAFVSAILVLLLLCFCIVSQSFEYLLGTIILSILVGSLLSLVAMFYVKGIGKKFLMFIAPVPYMVVLFLILMNATLGGDFPLFRSEVKYKTQEDIESLLGVDDLPELGFSRAVDASFGKKVLYELANKADSAELRKVFEMLKNKYPLQIKDGDMFMKVDNVTNEYTNIVWRNDGLVIIYGDIRGRDGQNKEIFNSIQAPLPKNYKYITYRAEQIGSDWTHDERIEFDEPVSLEWIAKIKMAAKTHEHWDYNEDYQSYSFCFDYGGIDENLPRIFTKVKLYKNLNGERKIADISWGDY